MANATDMRWLRRFLACITLLLAVIAVELSVLVGPIQPRAAAQIPDSGLQRQEILAASNRTNQLLGELVQHLKTQVIKVKVVGTDKDTKPASGPQPAPVR